MNFLQVFFAQLSIFFGGPQNTTELLANMDLPSEQHTVVTEDQYLLNIFRVPRPGAQPVVLFYGLFGSSDHWAFLGRNGSLSAILYDHGYDVWLGNVRGSIYGKGTVDNPNPGFYNSKFWNFSMDEFATRDLPAVIDYVLQNTGKDQILFAGHSISTFMTLALTSSKPEYNDKIKAAFFLSPVGYPLSSTKHIFQEIIINHPVLFADFSKTFFVYELLTRTDFSFLALDGLCTLSTVLCEIGVKLLGSDSGDYNRNKLPFLLGEVLDGTSANAYQHLAQNLQPNGGKYFSKFDFGSKNEEIYGTKLTPYYNLSTVTIPIAILHLLEGADNYSDDHALKLLMENAVNARIIFVHRIMNPDFHHFDFVLGKDAKDVAYNHVVEIFQSIE